MKTLLFIVSVVLMISVGSVYAQNTPDTGAEPPTPLIGEFLIEENM